MVDLVHIGGGARKRLGRRDEREVAWSYGVQCRWRFLISARAQSPWRDMRSGGAGDMIATGPGDEDHWPVSAGYTGSPGVGDGEAEVQGRATRRRNCATRALRARARRSLAARAASPATTGTACPATVR